MASNQILFGNSQSSLFDEVSKVYINHFQKISLIIFMDLNNLLDSFKQIFSILNIFSITNKDIFSNDCFVQRFIPKNNQDQIYLGKMIITQILPIFISLISLCFILILGIYQKYIRKLKNNNDYFVKIVILFSISIFIFYPLITKSSLSLFNCISLEENNQSYMYDNPNLLCWSSTHYFYFFIFGLSGIIVFGVGFPIALFLFIKRSKKIFDKPKNRFSQRLSQSQDTNHEYSERNKKMLQNEKIEIKEQKLLISSRVFQFFYKDYKNEVYFWETVIFLQKFLLNFLQNLNQLLSSEIKSFLFMFILIIYLALVLIIKPFHREYINLLEINSVIISILTNFCLAMALSDSSNSNIKLAFTFFQLFLNLFFISHIAYILIRYNDWKKTTKHTIEKMQKTMKKIKNITRTEIIFNDKKSKKINHKKIDFPKIKSKNIKK